MDISKEDLRNMISIVLQDPVLFTDTIQMHNFIELYKYRKEEYKQKIDSDFNPADRDEMILSLLDK